MEKDINAKLVDWFSSGKTGASSKCMANYLTGRDCDGSYPHDGGDFGRCLGLLEAVPELRPLLPKMAEVNRYWKAIAPRWDEIEAAPLEKRYEVLQSIIRPIEDADASVIRMGKGVTMRFGGTIK